MADHVRETFKWHWTSALRPPCALPEYYQDLCPCFTLFDMKKTACDFELSKMVQATFYAMLLNDAVELGLADRFMAASLRASLEGLRWTSLESWLNVDRRGLLEVQLRQRTPPMVIPGQWMARKKAQVQMIPHPLLVMESSVGLFKISPCFTLGIVFFSLGGMSVIIGV